MKKWINESEYPTLSHLEELETRRRILQAEVNELTEEIQAVKNKLNQGKDYKYELLGN